MSGLHTIDCDNIDGLYNIIFELDGLDLQIESDAYVVDVSIFWQRP
jgi:hypothetical protein